VIDESLGDEVRVTVIATGFGTRQRRRRLETPIGQPAPETPAPPRPEGEPSDTELEIPSFLRED
jgi:cell division GTPase FtsZ